MCAVSAISDYYLRPPTTVPNSWPLPQPKDMDTETRELLRKVVELLDRVDKRLGDKECMDETKKEFYNQIGFKDEWGDDVEV